MKPDFAFLHRRNHAIVPLGQREKLRSLSHLFAFFSAGLSSLLFVKPQPPLNLPVYLLKMVATTLSPLMALAGGVGAFLGVLSGTRTGLVVGTAGALAATRYVRRAIAPHDGFAEAFGADWERRITPEQAARMHKHRWTAWPPISPTPRWQRNVVFWTLPEGRELRCDLWLPPANVPSSGVGFIYCHGGGWCSMDKDFGTRPLFRALAAQGHAVMDVAYRLWPETDLYGMVGDLKCAIAWLKAHGGDYGISPQRIVVSGGSAGGHLALLAAYTPTHPALTSPDLVGVDLSVRAVVSYYGAVDMRATDQKFAGNPQIRNLLGGSPAQVPELYALASPITHVHAGCPPTLLFQGEHDWYMPVPATRALYRRLKRVGVPVVYVEFPQTDHAFDLLSLPGYSPPAQAALYDLERLLSLICHV